MSPTQASIIWRRYFHHGCGATVTRAGNRITVQAGMRRVSVSFSSESAADFAHLMARVYE